jgi:REP element-mobilizing transposase RayT
MARRPRIDHPDARHHVMNRGARRQPVFLDESWYERFLWLLDQTTDRYGLVVHGYALMPNHFHLMVQSTLGNLSDGMRFLTSRYGRWLNEEHGWDGSVFRDRFRNRRVTDDAYWRHLLAYLHLNPIRAGLAPDPDRGQWTSHRAYVGLERTPAWLETGELLSLFRGRSGYLRYLAELRRGVEDGPQGFDPDALYRGPSTPPPARPAPAEPSQALLEVAAITARDVEDLRAPRRGRRSLPERWLAMWWLRRRAGLTQRRIAGLMGTGESQVSRDLARIDVLRGRSPTVRAWSARLLALERRGVGEGD